MLKRSSAAYLVFISQIVASLVSGTSQTWAQLVTGKHISPSWLITWELFLLLNLVLVYNAYRILKIKTMLRGLAVYSAWLLVITVNLFVLLGMKGFSSWLQEDSIVMILVTVGAIAVLGVSRYRSLPLSDPFIKGWLGFFFRLVPQGFLAYTIFVSQSSGLSATFVILGHYTILTRIWQVCNDVVVDQSRPIGLASEVNVLRNMFIKIWRDAEYKNTKATLVAELGNEFSWLVVTAVWWFCAL